MPNDRQRRIRELFDAATEQPLELQQVYLERACDGDTDLMKAVSTLLRARNRADGMLDNPLHQRQAPVASTLESGTRVGAYKILRQLGGGGMGLVYQVVRADQVFQRVAALKIIRPEFGANQLVDRFRQEREILARLDHVNIARIIDGGSTTDGLPYFVMDYVDGIRIDQYCSKNALTIRQRLSLFQQVCSAVQYLHLSRIVHGDLKPSNILVTSDGQVKLLDFGVARLLRQQDAAGPGNDAFNMMTPAYASPEQKRGADATYSSDIFSLGVILYELLTGSRPFPAEKTTISLMPQTSTTLDVLPPSSITQAQTTTGIPGDSARILRTLKGDLDAIVLHAIRFDPAQRYGSAAALTGDITNYMSLRTVAANPGGPLYRLAKFSQRNRTQLVAASVLFVLSSVVLWQGVELRRRYDRATELEQKVITLQQQLEKKRGSLIAEASHLAPGSPQSEQLRYEQLSGVHQLAQELHESLSESVRLWPGMTPARHDLVEEVDHYLRQAESTVGHDEAAREQLAWAWLWLADLQGNPNGPNLRDHAAAVESLHQSHRLLSGLARPSKELQQEAASASAAISGTK